MNIKIKKAVVILFATLALVVAAGISATVSFADTYYTISVEYKFSDGSPAYDPYKAVYAEDSNIDVQITNPIIPGYKAVNSLAGNAENTLKTAIKYTNLNEDKTIVVYYVPAEVNYRVRYYFQNVENDLYTERLNLDSSYTDKSGITGTYPAELENIEFEGFTTLFHEPDVIAADGSTVFQIYYDRNYVLMNFDLDGGYGVEPIYAKYETHFNIAEPHKSGYVFEGWRNENGNVSKFTSGEVPAHDTTYTAVWKAVDTNFTVIFWTENANDSGYSYNTSKPGNALSGTSVNSDDFADEWEYADKDYFIYDSTKTETRTVEGDGSTILNVYFKRRVYTLKFYYARYKTNEKVNVPINISSITSGESYYLYSKTASKYLTSYDYNNETRLAFGNYNYMEKFTFEAVDGGYYVKNSAGQYLTIGSGSSAFTSDPKIINIAMNDDDGYWSISENGQYLNDYQGSHNCLAGWSGNDNGSRWYIGDSHNIMLNSQVCTRTNNFATNSVDADEIPVIELNDTIWNSINSNDLPVLSERYQETKGEENVGEYTYCYFTIKGKYEESLAGKWPLNDLEPIKANGRMNFFGAWNPTTDSYYYSVKDELFNENNTIKGEYQKINKFILIKNKPDRTIVPFLGFWTNSLSLEWNWSRQWIYHIYVPVLEGETIDEPHVYNDITYKKHAMYNTFDTNEAYNEQTPTALDGFAHISTFWSQNDENYILEHDGGNTNMPSYNANFYYERLSYNLEFSGYADKTVIVPYETKLSSYYFEPEYPDEKQKDFYEFGGWYTTEQCYDGTEFIFSETVRMPANPVILFAKWEKVTHNVTFYNNYSDYTNQENALSTAQTIHNEMLITTDVPTELTPIIEDAQFTGWYYYDNKNNKVRFDPQSIPVTRDLSLFAEWSSKKTAKYHVKYVEQGTDTPVADDTDGTAFIGKTKTFQAKGDNALNASHAWQEGDENWWPIVPSHSILIEQNTEDSEPNTYVFEYIKKASVGYTVRYVNAQTGEEVHDSKQVDSKYSIVSEHFVYVEGMISDAVSKTLVLAAYDTIEAEYQNNVITFYYTSNTTEALYQVNHHIQNTDGNGYALYSTETEIVNLNTEINPTDSSITIPGFEFAANLTTVNGDVEAGKGVADGNILIIDLYYNRLTYGYIVYYREYGNEGNILETIDKKSDLQILGAVVTHIAPNTHTKDNNLYTRVGEAERTLEIRADSGETLTLNVINVYYQKKTFYTVNYKAVCIPETTDTFGQVSLAYEIVDGDSQPQGSAAMLLDDMRYEFKGWYNDEQGNNLISSDVNYVPMIHKDATYYAIFSIKIADITITQSGGSENDNFLYRVTDENNNELIVAVNGGGTVTIKDLPCGDYTITEITDWDWRYNPDSNGSEKNITVKDTEANQVTFTNNRNDKNWLGGESNKDNLFNQDS